MKSLSALQWWGQCLRFFAVVACSSQTIAHPNHDAIAEADWNPRTGSLEIALRVNAHELERAVSKAAGEALDLDDETAMPHLKKYIASNLRCSKADGTAVEVRWIGAEIKVRSAWVYIEFPFGVGAEPVMKECSLVNSVFFDQYDDQKNTIALRLRADQPRRFLRFSKARPVVKLQNETNVQEPDSAETTAAQ